MKLDSLIIIHWIIIYPADSTIQRLNNWGQPFNRQQQQDQSLSRVLTGTDTGLRNWTHLDPVHNWAVPRLHTYASAILSFKMPEHENSLCPQRILMLSAFPFLFLAIHRLVQIIHDWVLCERLKAYFLSSSLFICSLLLQLMKYIINII